MKKILLYMFLFLGNITLVAQNIKEDSINNALYDQALKALEERSFIITYDTDESNRGRIVLDNRRNFLILKGENIEHQIHTGLDSDPNGPYLRKLKLSELKKENDDGTYSTYIMNLVNGIQLKILLKKGTNECKVYYRPKSRKKYLGGYYQGRIYPVGAITVLKGVI